MEQTRHRQLGGSVRWILGILAVVLTTVVALGPAGPARADTMITVTTTTDGAVGSVRWAFDQANGLATPSTIVLGSGVTYDLTVCGAAEEVNASGDLDLTSAGAVKITGHGAIVHQTCTDARVLDHHGPGSLALADLTLTGGNASSISSPEASGLGLRSAAAISGFQLAVTGNTGATAQSRTGEAVYLTGSSTATFDTTAVWVNDSAALVDDSTSASPLTITGSIFRDNRGLAPRLGTPPNTSSAIIVRARHLTISDTEIDHNIGPDITYPPAVWPVTGCECPDVGAILMGVTTGGPALSASRIHVHDNIGFRGSILGDVDVSDSTIEDNWSAIGGGVDGNVALHRDVIRHNRAAFAGGGVYGTGTIEDSTIDQNTADFGSDAHGATGGGVEVVGPMRISRSTVTDNVATIGGGVAVDRVGDVIGSLLLEDSTVAGNTSQDLPGNGNDLEIVPVTNAVGTVRQSIIGNGDRPGPACVSSGGALLSGGFNVVSSPGCFSIPAATDRQGVGGGLVAPLADNGGPTPTRLPAIGSPAVDIVPTTDPGCTGTDQRGVARPQGPGCDAGAVEARKGGYHPVAPERIVDSRSGAGTAQQRFGAGESRSFALPASLPVGHVSAVVLNVTASNPSADSHLTLWPTGQAFPPTSNVNITARHDVAGLVTVGVRASDDHVSIFNNQGTVDVIVDIAGWYDDGVSDGTDATCPCGDGFVALDHPTRFLDTRPGTSTGGPATRFGMGEVRTLTVGGRLGVPADATGVVINMTVTDTTAASHLTLGPSGTGLPTVSNLNWDATDTIANLAIVKLGADGKLQVRNDQGLTDVIGDVAGYFTGSGAADRFTLMKPTRAADTRTLNMPLPPGGILGVTLSAFGAPIGATGMVLTATGVAPTAQTHITAWGAGPTPTASNVDLGQGQTRANLVTVPTGTLDAGGHPELFDRFRNNEGNLHLVVDLTGYYG